MTSQKNSIRKNLAARRALFLTPVHFPSPNLPLHHLNIPLKTAGFFPEVFLIKNTFEKCTSLGAFGLHLCTYTSLSLGISVTSLSVPNNTLLFFEGTVQNFTETDYLQERGLISWCGSSHKDIRLSQLFSPVVSGCWQGEMVKLFITVRRVHTSLSLIQRCHSAKTTHSSDATLKKQFLIAR